MSFFIENPSQVWLTSDLHFFHKNILSFVETRGSRFSSTEEMNNGIVEEINSTVGAAGTLYHLGDLSFGKYDQTVELLSRINVNRLFLIYGNHDNPDTISRIAKAVNTNHGRLMISFGHERINLRTNSVGRIVLDHYPLHVWRDSHRGSIHFHGHTHGSLSNDGFGRRADVGWDSTHFGEPNRLFRLDEAIEHMMKRAIAIHDHHQERP